MPIINRFADWQPDLAEWRHHLHRNPELLYDLPKTSAFVAEKLKSFGLDEVVSGIGRSGVVGVIRGAKPGDGRVIGLRADMDALPIQETGTPAYVSAVPGKMHACGHDGHTTMLLGAARYLAETRNFAGTAVVIFQPAEEGGAGAKAMIDDGLMDRFGIGEVYGMHNYPGMPVGAFGMRPGPIMAATDLFTIEIQGRSGHAAKPHETVDPVPAGAAIVQALQTIASRNVDPLKSVVVSVTKFHVGEAHNIIAETAQLTGTVRSLAPEVRELVEIRMTAIVEGIAAAYGAKAKLTYRHQYPITSNHADQTVFAGRVAAAVAGGEHVDADIAPLMVAEDFSYMLEARPGAFVFLGNGDSAGLHNSGYDFNDEAIPVGCSYWARLVETALPAG